MDLTAAQDTTALLLRAYRHGAFPMATSRRGVVEFFEADPRAVLPLSVHGLHVPRSVRKLARERATDGRMVLTSDRAFGEVVRACADVPRADGGTWINEWIIRAYSKLHADGYAHSVEAWLPGEGAGGDEGGGSVLVGGLYGVHIGAAFFGESMFTRAEVPGASGASKLCLLALHARLRRQGFLLLDTQFANHHTVQFGVQEVARAEYLVMLREALSWPAEWGG
jgi:leucyl/phenylalanyl-tRNA--protein transferase